MRRHKPRGPTRRSISRSSDWKTRRCARRSPGTIIEKTVSTGQVITSATGAFGGGTLLLKMADLSQVRVRALVNETDIGNIQPGQQATVIVNAYPERPFRGSVEKIEPQAVVQQNVTMFPVLVAVSNREGLLMPGMNGEVSVLVERRENVISVPNDAVRPPRDITAAAAALGLNADSVRRQVQAQFTGGMAGGGANGGDRVTTTSRGDVALGDGEAAQQGQFQQMPQPTAAQCAEVRTALDKKPALRARLDSLRAARMSGTADPQQLREQSRAIYAELGVDGRVAMGCMRAQRTTADASGGAAQRPSMSAEAPEGATMGGGGGRRGLVFVAKGTTFEPRIVTLGIANYDYTEVRVGADRRRAGRHHHGRRAPAAASGAARAVPRHDRRRRPGHAAAAGWRRRRRAEEYADVLIGEILAVALGALRANKMRSFLTMLGIVIGVAAVIAMIALGRGAQQAVRDRIASLGTTLLTVRPGQQFGRGVVAMDDRARLTMEDAEALAERATLVTAVQPEMSRQLQIQYLNKNTNTEVIGTTANYDVVRKYTLAAGRMFTDSEDEGRKRVAVLGPTVVQNLGLESAEGADRRTDPHSRDPVRGRRRAQPEGDRQRLQRSR